MNIHKQVATTASLLMIFAVAGAGMVGFTYEQTIDRIKHNEKMTLLRKLNNIIPANEHDNDLLKDTIQLQPDPLLGTEKTVTAYRARKQGEPIAVVLPTIAPNGYNGPIHLLVGIYHDGSIAGVRVVKHRETPGLGDVVESSRSDWILGFDDKSLKDPPPELWKVQRDGGVFDQFTGATITPRAVVSAVHSTLLYFEQHKKELFKPSPPQNV